MRQIYICTDTITGLYSALHDAWKTCRDGDAGIEIRGKMQQQLFCEYQTVEECEQKAARLERMIKRYLGYNPVFDSCWRKKSLYPLCLLGYSGFYRCFEL